MLYVAIAALICVAVTVVSCSHLIARLVRAHDRQRTLMLNQLLHLAGRTWQPPPTVPEPLPTVEDLDETMYDPGALTYP